MTNTPKTWEREDASNARKEDIWREIALSSKEEVEAVALETETDQTLTRTDGTDPEETESRAEALHLNQEAEAEETRSLRAEIELCDIQEWRWIIET